MSRKFHTLDWLRLCFTLKPLDQHLVSNSELAKHCSEEDCWVSYDDKVYDVTSYLYYHPGGAKILLESAGKDCTDLFNKHHKWVNIETLLQKFCVGFLTK